MTVFPHGLFSMHIPTYICISLLLLNKQQQFGEYLQCSWAQCQALYMCCHFILVATRRGCYPHLRDKEVRNKGLGNLTLAVQWEVSGHKPDSVILKSVHPGEVWDSGSVGGGWTCPLSWAKNMYTGSNQSCEIAECWMNGFWQQTRERNQTEEGGKPKEPSGICRNSLDQMIQ